MIKNNQDLNIDDEIDLIEIIHIISKKWVFILCFSIIVCILTAIYTFIKIPIYEVKSNIKLAFTENGMINNPDSLVEELRVIYINYGKNIKNKDSYVKSLVINKKSNNILEVTTRGVSNNKALEKNKEVLKYIQDKNIDKINRFMENKRNAIINTKREIEDINEIKIRNIRREIERIKNQKLIKIDNQIKKIISQDIKDLKNKIMVINKQTIPSINNKILLLKNEVLVIDKKVKNSRIKLKEYMNSIKKLSNIRDNTTISIQMLNYQNLILNLQNKIEDLELKKTVIENERIINYEINKKNLENIEIKNIKKQIENLENITIKDLENSKENLINDKLVNLNKTLEITLENKKKQLEEKINILRYSIEKNAYSNALILGNYIMSDYPIIKEKRLMMIFISLFSSIIISIFFILFYEFIKKGK